MATITFYARDNGRNSRRSRSNTAGVIALFVVAAALASRRPPSGSGTTTVKATTSPSVLVVEKIVYVDRPILRYAEPIGPPVATPPKRERVPPKPPRPATETAQAVPVEPPATTTEPVPVPVPPPTMMHVARVLDVNPLTIHFKNGGNREVVITNANATAIEVRGIRIKDLGHSTGRFVLADEKKCIRRLQPGEKCTFNVIAWPHTTGEIGVFVDHDR